MLTLADRAALYNSRWPTRPPMVGTDRWLTGVWMGGNNYRGSGYYGSYPPGYLDRVTTLFPDIPPDMTLHLFAGSVQAGQGLRLDIRADMNPDIVGDAHDLGNLVGEGRFGLILADPPYSKEDSAKYGTGPVNRKRVVGECAKALRPGGFLVWLDTVLPMYRKADVLLVGTVGIAGSTNHRVRMAFVWQRVE